MKINDLNSTLSCTLKCIRFVVAMINKKIILGLLIVVFLGACTSPSAMLGPAYTFSSSGNAFQTGLSYGSNQIVTKYTGKTLIENLQKINLKNQKEINIKKKTLESQDFQILVKKKIDKVSGILQIPNQ